MKFIVLCFINGFLMSKVIVSCDCFQQKIRFSFCLEQKPKNELYRCPSFSELNLSSVYLEQNENNKRKNSFTPIICFCFFLFSILTFILFPYLLWLIDANCFQTTLILTLYSSGFMSNVLLCFLSIFFFFTNNCDVLKPFNIRSSLLSSFLFLAILFLLSLELSFFVVPSFFFSYQCFRDKNACIS